MTIANWRRTASWPAPSSASGALKARLESTM
jgi:hypothetical protein